MGIEKPSLEIEHTKKYDLDPTQPNLYAEALSHRNNNDRRRGIVALQLRNRQHSREPVRGILRPLPNLCQELSIWKLAPVIFFLFGIAAHRRMLAFDRGAKTNNYVRRSGARTTRVWNSRSP